MSLGKSISRRRFLALTATSTVACSALSRRSAAAAVRADAVVRVGVIGCGVRGTQLMGALAKRKGVQVAAVCDVFDPRKREARALSGAEVCPRWQDMVERQEVDAVVIATPDHWHAPIAVAARECGKDVYCEPPMALHLEEAKVFRACAARTGRIVQIGAEQTSEGQWHAARDTLRAGRIGNPLWSQGSYSRQDRFARSASAAANPTPFDLDWAAFHGENRHRPFDPDRYARWWAYWDYSGGVATGVFYSKLAALLLALGPAFPRRVSAAGGVYACDGREVPDSFVMTCQYPAGHTVVLASAMAMAAGRPAIIRGEKASLEFLGDRLCLTPESGSVSGVRAWRGRRDVEFICAKERPNHLDDWLDGIRTRRRCVCDEELGFRTMVAIAMAVQAYRESQTLYFDEKTEQVGVSPSRSVPVC